MIYIIHHILSLIIGFIVGLTVGILLCCKVAKREGEQRKWTDNRTYPEEMEK